MSTAAPLPWYRHFWPWFVLGLLGTSIVGSLTTVYIAISGRDPEVRDTWSKEAKAVTRDDAPDRLGRELGLGASVVVAEGGGALRVDLHGAAPATIAVRLVHPTLEQRDVTLTLAREADGSYAAELPGALTGRFHLTIEGRSRPTGASEAAAWRITGRIDLVPGRAVSIGRAEGSLDRAKGSAGTDEG